jgi:hypothetical protein
MHDREAAARRLAVLLRESIASHRGAAHFVIGHSHGGNVALSAVASPDLADVGLVCLSTPILYAIPRAALTDSNKFLTLILSIPILIAILGLVFLVPQSLSGLSIPLMALFSWPFWLMLKAYRDWAKRAAEGIKIPYEVRDQVLFLRFVGDEASLALGAFQALQYAMNRLVGLILAVFSGGVRFKDWATHSKGAMLAGILMAIGIVVGAVTGITWLILPWIIVCVIGLLALLLTPFLAFLALATGLASILIGVLPFGLRLAIATMWIELCVESLPRGRWNALVLEPSAQSAAAGLRHSFGYQDEPAIQAIVEHLKGKRKVRRRTASSC